MSARNAVSDTDDKARDAALLRWKVEQIIDSYTLCMVGSNYEEYVAACADDVLHEVLGWPVRYDADDKALR